jgi:hypothetical protein
VRKRKINICLSRPQLIFFAAPMSFSFRIDHTVGAARSGILATPHREVETPAFMPVGTLASVEASSCY